MGFGLFFVPLIGGYLFLTLCNYTRFLLERQTGYRLLFNSASVGILLVMSAWLVTEAVDCLVPSVGVTGAKLVPIPYAGTAALAFALGPFSAMLVNVWYTDINGAMRAVDAAHNEMESLFISSVKDKNLVEVTLKNGKVYVGWIVNADVPELDREFVAISPLISGFRNEKQEIVFTVNYANVYVSMYGKDWGSQVDRVYFRIVLPSIHATKRAAIRCGYLFPVPEYQGTKPGFRIRAGRMKRPAASAVPAALAEGNR